jgi:hypothetical protein
MSTVQQIVDNNWIETEAREDRRTSWSIIRAGKIIHSEEQGGDDAAGVKAFEAGLQWARMHYPSVAFHWRHGSLAATAARRAPASPRHPSARAGSCPGSRR